MPVLAISGVSSKLSDERGGPEISESEVLQSNINTKASALSPLVEVAMQSVHELNVIQRNAHKPLLRSGKSNTYHRDLTTGFKTWSLLAIPWSARVLQGS